MPHSHFLIAAVAFNFIQGLKFHPTHLVFPIHFLSSSHQEGRGRRWPHGPAAMTIYNCRTWVKTDQIIKVKVHQCSFPASNHQLRKQSKFIPGGGTLHVFVTNELYWWPIDGVVTVVGLVYIPPIRPYSFIVFFHFLFLPVEQATKRQAAVTCHSWMMTRTWDIFWLLLK